MLLATARGYEFLVAINLIPSDIGPRNDHHPVRFRLRIRDLTSIVHRWSPLAWTPFDIGNTSDLAKDKVVTTG